MNKNATKKIYAVAYASFSIEDNEIYTETIGVFNTLDEAKKTLEKDYKAVRNEDFSSYEDDAELNIKKTEMSFSIDNDTAYVTEKIEEKRMENVVYVSTYTDNYGCSDVGIFNTLDKAVEDMKNTYDETLASLQEDEDFGIVGHEISGNCWRICTNYGTYCMQITEQWAK